MTWHTAIHAFARRQVSFSRQNVSIFQHRSIFTPFSARFYSSSSPSTPTDSLFVARVPRSTKGADLEAIFSKFGNVKDAQVTVGTGGRALYGFVTFEDIADSVKAYEASLTTPIRIQDQDLALEYRKEHEYIPGPVVALGNLPSSVIVDDVRKLVEPYGEVLGISITRPSSGTKAYIRFPSKEAAEKVFVANLSLEGVPLEPAWPEKFRDMGSKVGLMFCYWFDGKDALFDLLAQGGFTRDKIRSIFIRGEQDPTRRIDAGFVNFYKEEDAAAAKEYLNGLEDQAISVVFARPLRFLRSPPEN